MRRNTTVLTLAALVLWSATGAALPPRKPNASQQAWGVVEQLLECSKKKDSACIREKLDELQTHAKHACGYIAEEFRSQDEEMREPLATALVELKCKETAELAFDFLSSKENEGRGPISVIFAATKDKALVEPISQMVKRGRPFDKEKGCVALALIGDEAGVPALVKATKDPFFSVRLQAAESLRHFPGDASRGALCRTLAEDKNSGVRGKAAESLSELKDIKSVPCLWAGLNDKTGAVKTATHRALVTVSGVDVGLNADAWEMWWDKNKPEKKR